MPDYASPVEHKSHGVPLEEYVNTRRDVKWQKDHDDIVEGVKRIGEEERRQRREEEKRTGVPWTPSPALIKAAKMFWSYRADDHDLMRWRVRLFCGHIAEAIRHITYPRPTDAGTSAKHCPECGMRDRVIVAYEPIEPKAPRPNLAPPPPPKAPTRADLQRKIKELEAEVRKLKAE